MASVLRNPVYMTYPSTAHRVRHVRRTDPLAEAASADEDSVCRAVEFRVYDRDPDPSLIPDDLLRDDSSSSSEDDDDSMVIGPPEHLDAEEDDDEDHHEPYRIENRSRNLVDFQNARQTGPGRFEQHSVEDEYVTRYLLTHNMLTEHVIRLDRLDKVFSAEWLSDRQVVFGTKCNKLMVYNVIQRKVEQIPSLARPIITAAPSARKRRKLTQLAASLDNNPEVKGGIHAVRINKSKTLLVTGGKQSCDVAVYALPTFDPVYVGAGAHDDLIFDITWIDDQVFVSGSRDSTLAIWKVPSKDLRNVDSDELPRCQLRTPVLKQKCMMGEKVRTMGFNPKYPEIVAVSMNAYIHLFDPFTLKQKYSRKLPHLVENVCVAVDELKDVYAIGSKSHATLIDARTLTPTEKIGSRMHGCGIRSLSFLGNLLTMGTGMGQISFYDLRAKKFLESSVQTGRCVTLKMSHGTVVSDEAAPADLVAGDSVPAIYTHCYDYTGTRLFAAGGPLQVGIQGNYASVWQ